MRRLVRVVPGALLCALALLPDDSAALQCGTTRILLMGPTCQDSGHDYVCRVVTANCGGTGISVGGLPARGFQSGDEASEATASSACGSECTACGMGNVLGAWCPGVAPPPTASCGGEGDVCPCGTSEAREPVLVATGTMYLNPITDFRAQWPHGALELRRFYRTDAQGARHRLGRGLGPGWGMSFEEELVLAGAPSVEWTREDGVRINFEESLDAGTYYPANDRSEELHALGTDWAIVSAERTSRRVFRAATDGAYATHRLAVLQRPVRTGDGWRDVVRIHRWQAQSATHPACTIPPGDEGLEGSLCRVELLDPSATSVIATLRFVFDPRSPAATTVPSNRSSSRSG